MSYAIADEPHPTTLGQFVVRPNAPLLASMMCGAWLAWPWFAFNSIAMGSPTKRRELTLCGLALGGTVVLALIVYGLVGIGVIESKPVLQLALLGVTTWKLGMAYAISTVQGRTFQVYTYYGGLVRPAYYVLVVGSYLRAVVLGAFDDPLWVIIVAGGL